MQSGLLNRVMALLAFVILVGFVGILVAYVPRWDLAIMVSICIGLAGWDIWRVAMGHSEDKH
ncbi:MULTISPECIES: hypothetical protein [Thalassospira]|jgi:hypothetical protein|uniref:Uncharacterized protein n=1 Tax=Thalassospira povalilytica TaxID=732237 RepID=A0A8I1MAK6_9PROT|nr:MULTISPECIES: hypothetical protein [Thalassospira]MEE3045638.1 hypothetical protein [Pseudomonadota bacterium]RCK25937.1 hypothetical protein TH8_09430 [Thalassospira profundimaris]KZB69969.1 hypothetical protein AUQ42_00195 [Thalassospira sp. MCCC 1A02491]MBN8198211.1 hypothetical protein [Thalassospira povalilytica]MBO6771650.1 hypothetical protein [Thalassospira sp.]